MGGVGGTGGGGGVDEIIAASPVPFLISGFGGIGVVLFCCCFYLGAKV